MFYLSSQFSGRGQDKGQRMLLPFGASITIRASCGGRAIFENMVQNGNQESSSFAGSGLGTSHQISPGQNNGQSIFLHGCGLGVAGLFDVSGNNFSQITLAELKNRKGKNDINQFVKMQRGRKFFWIALKLSQFKKLASNIIT